MKKKFLLIALIGFACSWAYGQDSTEAAKFNKWSIDAGIGLTKPYRNFTPGYWSPTVITSYSIHYTKLYEFIYIVLPVFMIVGLLLIPIGMRIFRKKARKAELEGKALSWPVIDFNNRITSYNVCYTKLLRFPEARSW